METEAKLTYPLTSTTAEMIQHLIRCVLRCWKGVKGKCVLEWWGCQVSLGDEFQAHISFEGRIFLLWYNKTLFGVFFLFFPLYFFLWMWNLFTVTTSNALQASLKLSPEGLLCSVYENVVLSILSHRHKSYTLLKNFLCTEFKAK